MTPKEKAQFEKLLEMGSGYVSNFSDASFYTIVADTTGLDIHCDKYTTHGSSKAKKLREFWRLESDFTVADLLDQLLSHEEGRAYEDFYVENERLVEDCKSTIIRLRSAKPQTCDLETFAAQQDAQHLTRALLRMQKNAESDPELTIGTAKELVETCCKMILGDREIEFAKNDDLPKLTKKTFAALDLLPDQIQDERRGSDAIKQVLRSFASITQAMSEIRNLYGTGHGRDGRSSSLQSRHAKLAAGAAATLCTFLIETHEGKRD